MSFTAEVKSRTATNELHPCYMRAKLTIALQMYSTMNFTSEGMHLTVKTEDINAAKHVFRFLKKLYQVNTQLPVIKRTKLKENSTYIIHVKNKTMGVPHDLEVMAERGLQSHPSSKVVRKECYARTYLAGALLAGRPVSSPSKFNYRPEISTQNVDLAKFIWKLMQRLDLPAKQTRRRSQEAIYLGASDKISGFLRCVGASDAVFAFEDNRTQRDSMNSLTRLDSCELANEMKSIIAGKKQLEDIQWIETHRTLDSLPERLQHVVYARKQLSETSLNELCEYYAEEFNEVISRSGMKHRLVKLRGLADQYHKE